MDAATRATETGREFRGATIEEAVSAASKALGVREEEIGNFAEVVDRGYKGFLGAGKRDARIKLRAAERPGKERGVGPTRGEETNRPFASTELASVKEIVDLPADKALDGAGQSRTFGCTLGTLVALS
jgi:predicted RNA-binding protein Jag